MIDARVGIGIVGLSAERGWAAVAHLPALKLFSDFEVRALVASNAASAARAAERHAIPLHFGSVADMVERTEVDLVVVTVKTPDHHAAVQAALLAGKRVFCEWPLGNGLQEAEDLATLAASKKLRTFIGLQARAAPVIRYVRTLVAEGFVGEVVSTHVTGTVAPFGDTVTPDGLYLLDRRNGASLLTIPFGHTIDAMCCCLGEFQSLSATLANHFPRARRTDTGEVVEKTVDDQIAVTGMLQNGAIASIDFHGGRTAGTVLHWEISGTQGELLVTGAAGLAQMTELRLQGRRGAAVLTHMPVPDGYTAMPAPPDAHFYALVQAYAQLLKDWRDGSHGVPDFGQAVVRHRMLDAVQAASETGLRQRYSLD